MPVGAITTNNVP